MTTAESVRVFLEHCKDREFSPLTIKQYESMLTRFVDVVGGELEALDYKDVLKGVKTVAGNHTPKYYNLVLYTVKSLLKYYRLRGLVSFDPSLLENKREPKRLVKTVKHYDVASLIDRIPLIRREKLMLQLMYSGGFRFGEVIKLKWSDVKSNKVKVIGKGNKERIVIISDETVRMVEIWKQVNFPNEGKYLFDSGRGTPIDLSSAYRGVWKFVPREVISRPHIIRHSYATQMVSNGMPLPHLQKLLGHDNLQSTSVYLHPSEEDLEESYKKSHVELKSVR